MKLTKPFLCLLFVVVQADFCFSQKATDNVFYLHTIPKVDTVLSGWLFRAGDSTAWADLALNDQNWKPVDPSIQIDNFRKITRTSVGWLRLKLFVDNSFQEEEFAFRITQSIASEIYLNGKLVKRYGVVNSDPEKVKGYDPLSEPLAIKILPGKVNVLAIRYAVEPRKAYAPRIPAMVFSLTTYDKAVENRLPFLEEYPNNPKYIFYLGLFFILTVLHIALFVYYPRQKANLYFAVYTLCFAGWNVMVIMYGQQHSISVKMPLYASAAGFNIVGNLFGLLSIYSVFGYNKRLVFILFTVVGIATVVSFFFNSSVFNWLLISSTVAAELEALRIAFWAKRHQKSGATIIVYGAIVLALVYVSGVMIQNFIAEHSSFVSIFKTLATVSIPVFYSLFIAFQTGFINKRLEQKLMEVQQLSDKNLALEKEKQQMLLLQNEMLEQKVKERTEELKASLQNLKEAQTQLVHSEKMASLGELTSGIAHEIQNPLNFVNNFSDVNTELITELAQEANKGNLEEVKVLANDIKENEQKINHHGKRADAIVKAMLQHSRASTGKKEPTDINALAEEYLRLSYHGLRAKDKDFNANFETHFDDSIDKIPVVQQDMGRVLLNLFNNAFYSVYQKKKQLDGTFEPTVLVSTKKIGNKIEIAVKDNGVGIPEKIVSKIYQPFFTTKPTGQGTGLGLSLSYDIITKGHGGEIKVETKEGEGAEFILKLPITIKRST